MGRIVRSLCVTWSGKGQRLPSFPALHFQKRQSASERHEAVLMYSRVDDPEFRSFTAKRELAIVSLEVIEPVYTLLVQDNQMFIPSPAKADNFALVPLQANNQPWSQKYVER